MKEGDIVSDRYSVKERIGEGGMQYVHRATDLLIGHDVAIKTPKPGQADKRFKASARIAARINNHYVAKTLDYVETNEARFLVEELVTGDTLKNGLLALAGYVDPHLAARILSKLAKGLAASHQAGVVHRDLKPSNILVAGGFDMSELKITDFGIATLTEALFEEEIASGADLTQSTSGTVKGALPYMAPEMMFRKKGDQIGSEADVWSLGALLYELICGYLPFGEGFIVPANIMNGKRAAWPPFLTSNDQFSALSRNLMSVIESCLQVDKTKRPTAIEVAQQCIDLCYFSGDRFSGTITGIPHKYGFIQSPQGKVFFHPDSVYGPNKADVGKTVFFCKSPGHPYPRAFPLVVSR